MVLNVCLKTKMCNKQTFRVDTHNRHHVAMHSQFFFCNLNPKVDCMNESEKICPIVYMKGEFMVSTI